MNKVAAFALRRKNSILSMSEKMFCPPQPLRFWITPACAGKRRSDWIIRSIYWDHPRMCGEKDKAKEMGATTKGSPPRMRGKDTGCFVHHEKHRITPAYAGKRKCLTIQRQSKKGSPPRMRGKELLTVCHVPVHGITPACAGKRCRSPAFRSMPWDHPRVCGEKPSQKSCGSCPAGSPLRVRGKELLAADDLQTLRITPAYAGKR